MNIIQLIFQLLKQFVPMDPTQRASLELQGNGWWDKLNANDEDANPLLRKLKQYGSEWYVQVALAVSYIFLVKVIADFIAPGGDDEEED